MNDIRAIRKILFRLAGILPEGAGLDLLVIAARKMNFRGDSGRARPRDRATPPASAQQCRAWIESQVSKLRLCAIEEYAQARTKLGSNLTAS